MTSNRNSLRKIGENLPVLSRNERVRKNSMRLYTYLLCLSHFTAKDKPRRIEQGTINLKKITVELGIKYETLRKYWRILEETNTIKYCGPKGESMDWNKIYGKKEISKWIL